ncbi:choice-of-anchor J domain-containing protein [Flavobacterium hauense]
MKKLILFITFFILSVCCKAQLAQEGFEGTWPPAGWGITDNGIGTNVTWARSPANNDFLPPYTGTYAAYLNRENVSVGIPEDWLITPQFTVPANAQLRFFSRLTMTLDQGSIYEVRISSAPGQTTMANYSLLQTWTEDEINPGLPDYKEHIINIPEEFEGSNVYIAFIMKGDNMDRWLLDDIRVAEKCLMPENLNASDITLTTANLTWDTPSGSTQWEIQVLPASEVLTETGEPYNGTLPYHADGLTEGTPYKFYVRAICTGNVPSDWAGPFLFNTVITGATCNVPKLVNVMPYTDAGNTLAYGNDYSGSTGTSCGTPDSEEYLSGYEVVYAYTPDTDKIISVSANDLSGTYAGLFIYDSCANIGTECYAAAFNGDSTANLSIGQINVTAGTTYYIVISTSWATENTAYTLNIKEILCPYPVAVQAVDATTQSVNISWSEYGNATSWQYVLQPAGTGIPSGGTDTSFQSYNASGLDPNTPYEFYVRANCGFMFSEWVGPVTFSTLCPAINAPFTETFNSDSATQGCWVTRNVSGAAVWNLDNVSQPFEGDEAAALDPEFVNGNIDWLITPQIVIPANQRLRFHQAVNGFWGANSRFKVMLSTTGNDPDDFTTELLPSATYSNGNYQEYEIYMNTIPAGSTIHIAWIAEGGIGTLLIDNVIIDNIPPCPEPDALTAGNITTTSAQLGWTAGFMETSWNIVVQAPGSGVPTGNGVTTTNPYNANGLTANTPYEFYVRAACGGTNGNSEWVGPFAFATACNPLDVPFHETFNSDSSTTNCWKIFDANGGDDGWQLSNPEKPFEGDASARFNANFSPFNDDWLISPALNLTGNERLSYEYRANENIYPTAIEVLLSTTGTNPADFTATLVPVTIYNNSYYIKQVVDLSAYSGTVYIAWHGPTITENGSGMFIYIDDVKVEAVIGCTDPYNLAVNNVTTTSAQLSWTAGNNETQWEIVVQPTTLGAPSGPGIITSDNPYTATGLLSGTAYSFYIRSVCGTANSIWNGPFKFTTVITNDDCENAIPLTINNGIDCTILTGATVAGAVASTYPGICFYDFPNDVWFEFVATQKTHNITFLNISDMTTLHFGLYKGDCDTLEFMGCNEYSQTYNAENLIIGQKYMLRVFTEPGKTTTFDICIRNILPPIVVDNTTYTVEQLVNDVLINSECAQISNITYSTGTAFTNEFGEVGPNGIAYFEKNGSSFPIEKGLLLMTGDAMRAPGPEKSSIETGDKSWTGDADLDALVLAQTGIPMNSTNATILEFDFVPLIDEMSFDFLFASEEYGTFQCDFSDSFAFLLTDNEGNTRNVALVPNTTIPVSVVTIRDRQFNNQCSSENVEYFGKYNEGVLNGPVAATNFLGETIPMTARASVVPNTTYHIKMVIADRGGDFEDTRLDSAVFLAAGSFNIGSTTLGPDLTVADGTAICSSASHTIESGLSPSVFTFKWYKDDVEIVGATAATLTVTQTGTYRLEAQVSGANCIAGDSVLIEFYAPVESIVKAPENLVECSEDGTAQFDLSSNDSIITGTLNPEDLTITYHLTQADANSGANPLASPYDTTVALQTIYVHIVYEPTNCTGLLSFTVTRNDSPSIDVTQGCDNGKYTLEVILDSEGIYTPDNVTVEWVDSNGTTKGTDVTLVVNATGVYMVTVTPITGNGCPAKGEAIVDVISCDIPKGISPNGDTMNDEFDLSGFDVAKLSIFNRYGQEVYSKSNYTKEWHGQGKGGEELPTGTYYYSIERTNGETRTGWVYINRQE